MRISDWSSDVCSSDLSACRLTERQRSPRCPPRLHQRILQRSATGCDCHNRQAANLRTPHRKIPGAPGSAQRRSEEHTSELQSLMRISYAVFCLKKRTESRGNKKNEDKTRAQKYLNRIRKYTIEEQE